MSIEIIPTDNILLALNYLILGNPVKMISGKEFQKDGIKLTEKVPKYYNLNYNGSVDNPILGKVALDLEGVKASLGHGIGKEKAAAFAAVPEVIKEGFIYNYENNWKNRGYDTAVIIAPILFDNKRSACEVVIQIRPNRVGFYLHEVEEIKKLLSVFKTATEGGTLQRASKLIIAQYLLHVNKK